MNNHKERRTIPSSYNRDLEDLREEAMSHYNHAATAVGNMRIDIPEAITEYYTNRILEREIKLGKKNFAEPPAAQYGHIINRPAAVIGPGGSWPQDIGRIPKEHVPKCFTLGINHHMIQRGLELDAYTFLDSPREVPEGLQTYYIHPPYDRMTHYPEFSEWYNLPKLPPFANTAPYAVWLMSHFTTGPIYICGVDLYTSGMPQEEWANKRTLAMTFQWKKALEWIVDPSRIHAMSGPLMEIFP